FFGYFRPNLCTLLMDISEFGLQAAPGPQIRAVPPFYMKYLEQVWAPLLVRVVSIPFVGTDTTLGVFIDSDTHGQHSGNLTDPGIHQRWLGFPYGQDDKHHP
ncbi:hypothetical protein PILCRDRAFT_821495, partial [Piloderma croceum F 1598]